MDSLVLKNVCKKYKDFTLENVSFTVPKGCVMGLIGENGAGKSTTIKLILDMIRRDGGEISVLGTTDLQAAKRDIGVVPDAACYPELFTAKHINNIMKLTFENWSEDAYFGYLKRFSISPEKKFKELSRGMKVKLAIAAAISHKAKLLIFDEATSGLDPIIRDEILDIFYDYISDGESSILMSSHILSDLEKICDYITFIHNGKTLFCEEKDKLTEEYAILRCGAEQVKDIDKNAIFGRKNGELSVELLVKRSMIPSSFDIERAGIEDIMLLMSKGGGI